MQDAKRGTRPEADRSHRVTITGSLEDGSMQEGGNRRQPRFIFLWGWATPKLSSYSAFIKAPTKRPESSPSPVPAKIPNLALNGLYMTRFWSMPRGETMPSPPNDLVLRRPLLIWALAHRLFSACFTSSCSTKISNSPGRLFHVPTMSSWTS
jgi:hypothetical protein